MLFTTQARLLAPDKSCAVAKEIACG